MSDNTDTRPDEAKAPKKKSAAPKVKAPKVPKAPPVPWSPPADAMEAVATIQGYAELGDKKVLAYFVGEAINGRARGKVVRESLVLEDAPLAPSPADVATSDDEPVVHLVASKAGEALASTDD